MPERETLRMLTISLFGAPSIATPTGAISPAKPAVFAAALYLRLNRGRVVRRDELAPVCTERAPTAAAFVRRFVTARRAEGRTSRPELHRHLQHVAAIAAGCSSSAGASDIAQHCANG
jgi:hypothetical protein